MEAGRADEARTLAVFAVEELPGYEPLMAWEARLAAGEPSELDLRALVLRLEPGTGAQEETPRCAEEPEAPPEPEVPEHQPGEHTSVGAPMSSDKHEADDSDAADDVANADGEADSDDG